MLMNRARLIAASNNNREENAAIKDAFVPPTILSIIIRVNIVTVPDPFEHRLIANNRKQHRCGWHNLSLLLSEENEYLDEF